jgi:hypothetical protein
MSLSIYSYGSFVLLKNFRLCVVGLAPAHVVFKEEGAITAVDFNVGKSDRSEMKVTGKRKRVTRLLKCFFFNVWLKKGQHQLMFVLHCRMHNTCKKIQRCAKFV